MKTVTFNIDYTYCPEGHAWTFIPASTMYSDIFWCEKCECFYYPSVKRMTADQLNKDFCGDRAADLIRYAEFLRWREGLSIKDMPSETGDRSCL